MISCRIYGCYMKWKWTVMRVSWGFLDVASLTVHPLCRSYRTKISPLCAGTLKKCLKLNNCAWFTLTFVTASTHSPFAIKELMTATCPFMAAVWMPLAPLRFGIKSGTPFLKSYIFHVLYTQEWNLLLLLFNWNDNWAIIKGSSGKFWNFPEQSENKIECLYV